MLDAKIFAFAILFFGLVAANPQTTAFHRPSVSTCQQVTVTRPQLGVAYKSNVAIDDYKLTARIPEGMTGWGGVALDAPFHGFTMFLGPDLQSCILFEVHVRVADDEAPLRPHSAKTLSLGKANAWQTSESAIIGTAMLTNVETIYSFRQGDQIDDGEVLLVSPSTELGSAMPVYETFLRSIRFGAAGGPGK